MSVDRDLQPATQITETTVSLMGHAIQTKTSQQTFHTELSDTLKNNLLKKKTDKYIGDWISASSTIPSQFGFRESAWFKVSKQDVLWVLVFILFDTTNLSIPNKPFFSVKKLEFGI